MKEYRYITLADEPMIKDITAEWFHSKWDVSYNTGDYSEASNTGSGSAAGSLQLKLVEEFYRERI